MSEQQDEDDVAVPRRRWTWRHDLATAVVLLAGAAGGAAWWTGALERYLDKSHGAIAVCEAHLMDNLRSPATYKRHKAEYVAAGPLTLPEYREYQEFSYCGLDRDFKPCPEVNRLSIAFGANMDLEEAGVRKPTMRQRLKAREVYVENLYKRYIKLPKEKQETAFVSIEYDAANAYGTPLRGQQICRFGPRRGDTFVPQDMFGDDGSGDR